MNDRFETHIHVFKCGVIARMHFDNETSEIDVEWSNPPPPYPKKWIKKIAPEYRKWRDAIIDEWSKRTGKSILVVEV